jgi:NADPH:quinone reductase-like Zn-dependent oxidoreductase
MVERVLAISGSPVDIVLDTAPVGGALPDLVAIAGGDPKRVMTISDFKAAQDLGVRDAYHEDDSGHERYEAFPEFAQLAADGKFTVPVARTFPLEDWRTAAETSLSGHPHGKLLLLPGDSLSGAPRPPWPGWAWTGCPTGGSSSRWAPADSGTPSRRWARGG